MRFTWRYFPALLLVLFACILAIGDQVTGEPHDAITEELTPELSAILPQEDSIAQEPELSSQERGKQLYESAISLLSAFELPKTASTSSPGSPNYQYSPADEPGILSTTFRLITQSILSLFREGDNVKDEVDLGRMRLEKNPVDTRLMEAAEMLEKAGYEYGNNDALFVLAQMNFHSLYTYPRNYTSALVHYTHLAARTGNATAQQALGFLYATGMGGAVAQRDQGKALLFHTFAALGGDTAAEMTLGYRYLTGIGTPSKCEDALFYYKKVADKAREYYLSGPPGGRSLPLPKVRLADENGGVYGSGASFIDGGRHSNNLPDVIDYYKYMAQRNEYSAQLILAQMYYQGQQVSRTVPQDFQLAFFYLKQIANQFFPATSWGSGSGTGHVSNAAIGAAATPNTNAAQAAGQAAGMLGKMYWRGEYQMQDNRTAFMWFERGAELGNPPALNGLGSMYLEGVVVPQDREKAMAYFKKAADQDNEDAQVNLGMQYLRQKQTIPLALEYFTLAAERKHLLAYYHLAEMYHHGLGTPPSCQVAVTYYKMVAERGDWLHSPFEKAYQAYLKGDKETALLYFMLAAERGYEMAQSNLAWILDRDKHFLKIFQPVTEERDPVWDELALIYWTRAANQHNVDARIKMGDYYYRGLGTPVDHEKAAACYQDAADIDHSPLAMWNLGWMHENGIGVARDFHLAKRRYDSSLAENPDAYLPVTLSLLKLNALYLWNWIMGRDVGDAAAGEAASGWNFFEDSATTAAKGSGGATVGAPGQDGDEAGRAAKAAARRKDSGGGNAGDTQKPEWDIGREGERITNKYQNDRKQRLLEGGEEYDDEVTAAAAAAKEEYVDEQEDELIESLMILGLCVLVGWLVYVRQFRFGNGQGQGNNNNNNNANNANNANQPEGRADGPGGAPGDEDFRRRAWAAAGGH